MTIWQESRGESQAGMVAVAEVLRNRTARKYMSDGTLAGTCLLHEQFSGWNAHDPNRIPSAKIDTDDPIVARCQAAWAQAQAGSDTVNGAVNYYNPTAPGQRTPPWVAACREVARVGAHVFYVPA